jgi:DNA-binding transcriptional regulator YbjK
LERYKNLDAPDLRIHPRFVPARRRTKMVFADGTTLHCLIRDVSVSGAAITCDTIPAIGTVLAIGVLVGRVVRHFKGGFGVKFTERLSDIRLDAMVGRN